MIREHGEERVDKNKKLSWVPSSCADERVIFFSIGWALTTCYHSERLRRWYQTRSRRVCGCTHSQSVDDGADVINFLHDADSPENEKHDALVFLSCSWEKMWKIPECYVCTPQKFRCRTSYCSHARNAVTPTAFGIFLLFFFVFSLLSLIVFQVIYLCLYFFLFYYEYFFSFFNTFILSSHSVRLWIYLVVSYCNVFMTLFVILRFKNSETRFSPFHSLYCYPTLRWRFISIVVCFYFLIFHLHWTVRRNMPRSTHSSHGIRQVEW